jgi:gliding motility-associated-like protein
MVNTSTGAVSYTWNFGDGSGINTTANPEHEFPGLEPGNYEVMLIAESSYGCLDTAYQQVIVRDALIYYVPNAFTPDGDEFNQDFKPVFTSGFDPFSYHLTIYNRWGERIFESFDLEYGWNGTYGNNRDIVQDGIYTWTIHFKLSENDARRQIQGHVNVIK